MRFLCLFPSFLLGLASTAQLFSKSQARLMPRGMDDQKQLLKGKVSIEQVSMSFTQATQSVVTSVTSQNGDSVKVVTQQVGNVSVYAEKLTESVEKMDDPKTMVAHQETLVEALVSYVSMINVISDSKSAASECSDQLVKINTAFINITSIYKEQNINLHTEFNKNSKVHYDPAKFQTLKLASPFADQDLSADQDSTADQANAPSDDQATDDVDQDDEE